MRDLLDIGVDGIMTDETVVLRDVLISRGEWHPRVTR
jgi:glycerophosphoryl diester phosphodiesterase